MWYAVQNNLIQNILAYILILYIVKDSVLPQWEFCMRELEARIYKKSFLKL